MTWATYTDVRNNNMITEYRVKPHYREAEGYGIINTKKVRWPCDKNSSNE
jgi:hypothetical protein